ncbi:methyltransferase domain-containing protein [Xylophilus rhododendri]|uniref:Methyltransferase domain-containing protein n=1 Tax=Xylophilus rhododendri TaxID=2697032 RepID=A0A857J0R5_9BURK|nr:cyclopropane-fatty-acyl-phospholipid synthase family protein [Xylophilus rhododendri]QHI96691.1 methyltransferase domain-containing protein [Xylophilus rhododendri]
MGFIADLGIRWSEQGKLPDPVVRAGIRRLLRERLDEIQAEDVEKGGAAAQAFLDEMRHAPVALVPEKANEQHYEVPSEFFGGVLGANRKYSSCWWPPGTQTLEQAEIASLQETCERAGLAHGQEILELGCGWGSLSLFMAERYPGSRVTAVSNSASQRAHIEAEAARMGLHNLTVLTCDMNLFETEDRFDRIVSVEMFEHMRNWPELFRRLSGWLKPGGRFFMHVFVQRLVPYAFVERDESDWMSRYFFSGGMMPSDDMAACFQDDLRLLRRWRWDGTHYERTANAWLANMDARREQLEPVLREAYGAEVDIWWQRWRVFFMAVAELFGYERGQQWWVSHYLFEKR